MAIVNTYQTLYPGYGQPTVYGVINGTALAAASTTTSFTTANTKGLSQGMTKGLVRVKIYNGGSATTAAAVVVQVTDGTNTYCVYNAPAFTIANAANSGLDYYIDFGVDISLTQVNVVVTLSVGTLTASQDLELVAGP
jgi:hypothetical protein